MAETKTETRRIRRVRPGMLTKPVVKVLASDVEKMQASLKSISTNEDKIAKLVAEIAEAKTNLFKTLKTYKLEKFEDATLLAFIERAKGRAVSTIDVEGFKDLVSDEDFIACVKISQTEAKKVLSGKELDTVTTTVAAKLGDEQLVVVRKKQ